MLASTLSRAAVTTAAILLLALSGSALAAQPAQRKAADAAPPWVNSGLQSGATAALTGRSGFARQHGGAADHLPAVRENIDLVGRLKLDTPAQYRTPEHNKPVEEGQIADLAIYKQAAYLNSWQEPEEADGTCHRGGFFSADISNPADPKQLAFVAALPETYHGEGAHVVTFNGRDILAVNNEPCGEKGVGGFDLYDVTNPAAPKPLVRGAGDQSSDEPEGVGLGDTTQDPTAVPTSAHSIFLWQDGGKLYAVIVDNIELHDIDIFDVTDPTAPKFIADIDLVALADEQNFDLIDNSALGNTPFHHDMVVKKIGAVQTMLVSYWDAGYVKLNVNDPTAPTFIGDSDFGTVDPLTGLTPPEGNGHEAEFSHDNQFVLAADEDFSQFRGVVDVLSGSTSGQRFESAEPTDAVNHISDLPDGALGVHTTFVGDACDPATVPDAPADDGDENTDEIAVAERGTCFFFEKVQAIEAHGWDGFLIFNNADRPDGDPLLTNGVIDPATLPGAFITRADALEHIFHSAVTPTIGTAGSDVSVTTAFDGWGYMHLYRNTAGNLEPIDDFAIDEALDARYATGFGDLSVHEWATDPDVNVGYVAHYAGGMRVFTFGEDGLKQTGRFIDEGGNNFWGTEVVTTKDGERLFAGSDRDFGLYLLRYTGPGAFQPTPAPPAGAPAPAIKATGCENQIQGTAKRDLLAGTDGSDSVRAAAGDDVVDARAGDDCLFGEAGADSIDGEVGNDSVDGGSGSDQLKGGVGNDVLRGGRGVDRLTGNRGNDRLRGGAKRDVLSAGRGRDSLSGGSGNDSLNGGPGRDRISGGGAADRIIGTAGSDRIRPGRGRDRVIAGRGNDRILARDGRKDRISCGSGRDVVVADTEDELTSCERVSRR